MNPKNEDTFDYCRRRRQEIADAKPRLPVKPPPTPAETALAFAALKVKSLEIDTGIAEVKAAVAKNVAPAPAPVVPDLPGPVKSFDLVHVAALEYQRTHRGTTYRAAVVAVTRTP